MNKSHDQEADYVQFLSNPQRQGVWCLTIQLEPGSMDALRTLLNIRGPAVHRYRYYDSDEDEGLGFPAIVVPKLFSYLRHLMPQRGSADLPPLFHSQREMWRRRRPITRHDFLLSQFLHEATEEPKRLGPGKRRALAPALSIFKTGFQTYNIEGVPDNPSTLDLSSNRENSYFQVTEGLDGRMAVYALQEDTCLAFRRLFAALPNIGFSCESRKVFSPEAQLLAMYMPALSTIMPRRILHDASVLGTIAQSFSEVREGRFVHAIRALGIGAEELVVEVFETFLHDKAPEAPLGNLLAELNARIQDVQSGAKRKAKSPSTTLKKALGTIIASEKKTPSPNVALCALCELVLQNIIPTIEQVASRIGEVEEITARPQRTIIFPTHVNRALSDLVSLRNRVSHHVDRLGASRTVTYLETALALKSYIVLALWWQEERKQIDYRVEAKEAIKRAVERNRVERP